MHTFANFCENNYYTKIPKGFWSNNNRQPCLYYIIWIRHDNADRLNFTEVANFKANVGNLLSKKIEMMKIKYLSIISSF